MGSHLFHCWSLVALGSSPTVLIVWGGEMMASQLPAIPGSQCGRVSRLRAFADSPKFRESATTSDRSTTGPRWICQRQLKPLAKSFLLINKGVLATGFSHFLPEAPRCLFFMSFRFGGPLSCLSCFAIYSLGAHEQTISPFDLSFIYKGGARLGWDDKGVWSLPLFCQERTSWFPRAWCSLRILPNTILQVATISLPNLETEMERICYLPHLWVYCNLWDNARL